MTHPTSNSSALSQRAERVLAHSNFSHFRLMPPNTPEFFSRANGCRIWDADGREYLDFRCASGANLLGYGDPRVERAASLQADLGNTMSGPAPVMIDLAETLVGMVSHADWVLFAKNGTDVTTAALLVARAHTGRRRVLLAENAYHGWAPWSSRARAGIPREEQASRSYFRYNDVDSLNAAAFDAGEDLAAIFVTGYKHYWDACELPTQLFASRCRELCDQTGALLVVDDVFAGFRLARDCSWSIVNVEPDLSCWSKSLANGHALSALLGCNRARDAMSQVLAGGTFWAQAVPMAAALATLEVIRTSSYLEHMARLGQHMGDALKQKARKYGFEIELTGPSQLPHISFNDDPRLGLKFAFAEALLKQGIYMHCLHCIILTAAMNESDIERAVNAAEIAFADMSARRSSIEPSAAVLAFVGMS